MQRGVLYMIAATTLIAVMQALVKALPGIPIEQIIFFRAAFSLIFCTSIMYKGNISFKGKNYPLLICRGIVGTLSLATFFFTLQHIPLATAVTIGHLSPVFLSLLAMFFLKERISLYTWIALAVSFVGVIMIKGFDARVTGFEALMAIVSALLAALAHFTVRMLRDENPLTVLFYFSVVTMPLLLPFVISGWKNPDAGEWVLLTIVGTLSHFGQLYLTKALKESEISKISVIYYLGILLAILIGFLFFNESYNLSTSAGMLLILGSVLAEMLIKTPKEPQSSKTYLKNNF